MRQNSSECILHDRKNSYRCTALVDVHRDCGPKCPFFKTVEMERESRCKSEERLKHTKCIFQDLLPDGWDK